MTKETTTVCDQQPEPQEARDGEAVLYRLIDDPPFEGRDELLAEAAREAGLSPAAAHAQALALWRAARPQGD
ncbi:hypothetical protein ABZ234_31835 [Nocardiopsis sp. NPDC006198]|uniref:hypothetical protein n=1 Tax=Nocardiopsis sp. NPDC006198 TaxID=3154472 RepID=UPI0033B2AB35